MLIKNLRLLQFALASGLHQRLVRNAAPDKERQALGQFVIAQGRFLARPTLGLHHVDKLGRSEHRPHHVLHGLGKGPGAFLLGLVKGDVAIKRGLSHRRPEGPLEEGTEPLFHWLAGLLEESVPQTGVAIEL